MAKRASAKLVIVNREPNIYAEWSYVLTGCAASPLVNTDLCGGGDNLRRDGREPRCRAATPSGCMDWSVGLCAIRRCRRGR